MGPIARALGAAVLVAMGLGSATSAAQSPHPGPSPATTAALEVPYLPQSVLLCGGAALAMVERWWGRRGVYAEDFAGLVRPEHDVEDLISELGANLRAMLRDVLCGHLDPCLRGVADELLADQPEPVDTLH